MNIASFIRDVPDFPKPGIIFKDITPLLGNPEAFAFVIEALAERYQGAGIQKIVGIESRGFIFGSALALRLGCGFVPVRKPGKLPAATVSQSFDLEYGQDTIEIHQDALVPGEKVLVLDDVMATGGTLEAAIKLVETVGGQVLEAATILELTFLNGRSRLDGHVYFSLLQC
jgi:adenine phosphoribosyltransferase